MNASFKARYFFGAVVIAAVIVVLVFAFKEIAKENAAFRQSCEDMGGYVHSSTQSSNSYGVHQDTTTGNLVTGNYTTTTTTTYCISDKGGILAIQ